MGMSTRKGFTGVVAISVYALAILIPGFITYHFVSASQVNPYEKELRSGAQRRGLDPNLVVRLDRLENDLAKDRMTEATWAEIDRMRASPVARFRHDVYGIIVRAHGTSMQPRAVIAIEKMRTDSDPEIRARYGWSMMLVGASNWREICKKLENDPDPETRRLALQALDMGPKLGR